MIWLIFGLVAAAAICFLAYSLCRMAARGDKHIDDGIDQTDWSQFL